VGKAYDILGNAHSPKYFVWHNMSLAAEAIEMAC
jgi:hypothetical protein